MVFGLAEPWVVGGSPCAHLPPCFSLLCVQSCDHPVGACGVHCCPGCAPRTLPPKTPLAGVATLPCSPCHVGCGPCPHHGTRPPSVHACVRLLYVPSNQGKKKKRVDRKPFCYYCERPFDDEKVLVWWCSFLPHARCPRLPHGSAPASSRSSRTTMSTCLVADPLACSP